jgi:hypothetical protein
MSSFLSLVGFGFGVRSGCDPLDHRLGEAIGVGLISDPLEGGGHPVGHMKQGIGQLMLRSVSDPATHVTLDFSM